MIKTGYMKNAPPQILKSDKNRIIIDTKNAESKNEIIKMIGNKLSGFDSPKIQGRSLDALIDVVGDWAYETMRDKKHGTNVSIINVKSNLIDQVFIAELVSCLNSAILRGATILRNEDKNSDIDKFIRSISLDILISG